jgi:hypothetical protein
VGEFGGLKFVVDAKLVSPASTDTNKYARLRRAPFQVMYGASKRFIYTSFEHGNAMGDSIGHFDRIILKGTFERVKFNRYNFLCEEVPCSPLLCPYSLLCDNKNNKAGFAATICVVLFPTQVG